MDGLPGNLIKPDETALRARLAELVQEHRDLDTAIEAMDSAPDPLQVSRLKKRKLLLKDQIATINNLLLPDIIA